MEAFFDYLARYPVVQIVVAILFILFFLFILKKFFKMAILTILVVGMTLLGFYFFTSSGKFDEKVKSAIDKTKKQTERVVDSGKEFIKQKTEKITEDTGKLVEKHTKGASERKRTLEKLDKSDSAEGKTGSKKGQ